MPISNQHAREGLVEAQTRLAPNGQHHIAVSVARSLDHHHCCVHGRFPWVGRAEFEVVEAAPVRLDHDGPDARVEAERGWISPSSAPSRGLRAFRIREPHRGGFDVRLAVVLA